MYEDEDCIKSKRGSLWRVWDLHVHTPASLRHGYKVKENEDVWEKFLQELESLPSEFKVLGINDYIFIEGYKRLKEEKEKNGRLKNIALLLPVIELRLSKFGGTDGTLRRINYHVIFSPDIKPEIIEQHFLNSLPQTYKLSPEHESLKTQWQAVATQESLAELGKLIKSTVPATEIDKYESDLIEGFNNLNFDEKQVLEILNGSHYFKGKYLTAVGKTEWAAIKWNDQSIAEKKNVINAADFVFISVNTEEEFANAKGKLIEAKVNSRLLDCSDAHYFNDSTEKDRIGNCLTWIKGDATFNTLRHAVIEPEDRIFVGTKPEVLSRIESNPTKFVDAVSIKLTDTKQHEKWFEGNNLLLNPELNIIIGNKGSGKSALIDIISLLGHTKQYMNFDFLNEKKFRKPPENKSRNFSAELKWLGGASKVMQLSENPKDSDYEVLTYIPHNYFEKLCNEDKDKFEEELKNIIFSHVPLADRLSKNSLEELIVVKTYILETEIERLCGQISGLNKKIFDLHSANSSFNIKKMEDALKEKELQLQNHDKSKPAEQKPPTAQPNQAIQDELTRLAEEEQRLAKEIKDNTTQVSSLKLRRVSIQNALTEVHRLKTDMDSAVQNLQQIIRDYGSSLDLTKDIYLTVNLKHINELNDELKTREIALNKTLDTALEDSLVSKLSKALKKISELNAQLSKPQKEYQDYLKLVKDWEEKRKLLVGDTNTADSIEYLKANLKYVKENLPKEIEGLEQQRKDLFGQLIKQKLSILDIYNEMYKPIQQFVESNTKLLQKADFKISFKTSLEMDESFIERLHEFINLKSKGTFHGFDESLSLLKEMIKNADFNSEDGISKFVFEILEKFAKDGNSILSQLKRPLNDFLDYVFCLQYLEPKYSLELNKKELSLLSPGERGALLIIFYLLVDNNDTPLIIDQPEENLDNQSVYEILVPFIKLAKRRRQLIIVSHNPNLAVVCDAELVIHAELNKTGDYKLSYTPGSIENPDTNKRIVNVLEGTWPAFTNRDRKYEPTKRSFS